MHSHFNFMVAGSALLFRTAVLKFCVPALPDGYLVLRQLRRKTKSVKQNEVNLQGNCGRLRVRRQNKTLLLFKKWKSGMVMLQPGQLKENLLLSRFALNMKAF